MSEKKESQWNMRDYANSYRNEKQPPLQRKVSRRAVREKEDTSNAADHLREQGRKADKDGEETVMNTRRSFLATLAALFAAPVLPKPEFIVQRVGGAHCENSPHGTIHTIRAQGEMNFAPVSIAMRRQAHIDIFSSVPGISYEQAVKLCS